MRLWSLLFLLWSLTACNTNRIYEYDQEFKDRLWKAQDTAKFEFSIVDPGQTYNVYYNVRNSLEYPWSRLFVQYTLQDSSGKELEKKLLSSYLFDQKTGLPFGNSGLGDLYDHQFPILTKFAFKNSGKYRIQLAQFMRTDSLKGIFAIGVRVETTAISSK